MRNSSKKCLKRDFGTLLIAVFLMMSFGRAPVNAAVIVDRILAVVGEEVVTQSDLDRLLYAKGSLGRSKKKEAQRLLQQLIEEKLIVQEAGRRGIRVPEEEIEFALKDIETRNRFPDRASFQEAVSMESISWDHYVSNLKNQLLSLKLLSREISSKLKLGENAVQAYYEAFSKRFELPDRIRLRQILLRFPPSASEAAKKKVREQAEQVFLEARQGIDFARLVQQYSEGAARKKGGDLGFFRKGDLAKNIEQVVFPLKEGEVSAPLESVRGIHLFMLEKREIGRRIPFEKVRQDIEGKLLAEKRVALRKKWLDDLWERSFVEIKK